MLSLSKNEYIAISGIIVATVLALIGWIIYFPSSDFNVSINPMMGQVPLGGVVQTTVTVEGVHKYKYDVSLSASEQPDGVIVTFTPPFGGATPYYTSNVLIKVESNVPAGTYKIKIKGQGADGKEHSTDYTLVVMPSVQQTPLTNIIDSMESTMVWSTYKDDKGSSMNRKLIPGRTDNGIEISYDLKEWGWVVISKDINPEILSKYKGIRFYYKGSGEPNTIELKLIYKDTTTFGVEWHGETVTDDWVSVEVPYSSFYCWWPPDNCKGYGNELDLEKVRKIEFGISNKPDDGDVYGSGWVIIDDVQGIAA